MKARASAPIRSPDKLRKKKGVSINCFETRNLNVILSKQFTLTPLNPAGRLERQATALAV